MREERHVPASLAATRRVLTSEQRAQFRSRLEFGADLVAPFAAAPARRTQDRNDLELLRSRLRKHEHRTRLRVGYELVADRVEAHEQRVRADVVCAQRLGGEAPRAG